MRERIIIGAAFLAVVAIVVVALVVFQFGRSNPSPDSLVDHPNSAIPGEVLFRDEDNCLVRAAASGVSRAQVYCGTPASAGQGAMAFWIDANTVGFGGNQKTGLSGTTVVAVDLTTKAERIIDGVSLDSNSMFYAPAGPNGEVVDINDKGDISITAGGVRTEVASFDVSESWRLQVAGWSPDGQWFVLRYERPRSSGYELWIVSRDGKTSGTLARLKNPEYFSPGSISWRYSDGTVWPAIEGVNSPS